MSSRKIAEGARVTITPNGWFGRPHLQITLGIYPMLTAYMTQFNYVSAWRTTWGLYGPEAIIISNDELSQIMGWSKTPDAVTS